MDNAFAKKDIMMIVNNIFVVKIFGKYLKTQIIFKQFLLIYLTFEEIL